jgi:hypothetical protein
MINRLKFNPAFFALTVLLFIAEVLIALYVHDNIVRPYIGDLLVVLLIYCFVKSFFNFPVLKTAIGVLLFSYLIEILQYLKLVTQLGLQDSKAANIIIGNSFEWIDLVAYTGGFATILLAETITERIAQKKSGNRSSTISL